MMMMRMIFRLWWELVIMMMFCVIIKTHQLGLVDGQLTIISWFWFCQQCVFHVFQYGKNIMEFPSPAVIMMIIKIWPPGWRWRWRSLAFLGSAEDTWAPDWATDWSRLVFLIVSLTCICICVHVCIIFVFVFEFVFVFVLKTWSVDVSKSEVKVTHSSRLFAPNKPPTLFPGRRNW